MESELVPAKPRGDILQQGRGVPHGGGADQPVTGRMTERVVDGLEIIEIDDEQRPRSRLVAGHAGKGHVEGGAVWQSRECVDARAPFPVGDTLRTKKSDLA